MPDQALVEQCAAAGKAASVERCVLRLDLASLDFNQVPHESFCMHPYILTASYSCRSGPQNPKRKIPAPLICQGSATVSAGAACPVVE